MDIFSRVWVQLQGAWRSRTIWLAAGTSVAGLAYDQVSWLRSAFPLSNHVGAVALVLGVAFAAMRFITSTSLVAKIPGTPPAAPPA
jgi:hypothetical protein